MSQESQVREANRIHDVTIGYLLASIIGSLAVAIIAYIAASTVHEHELAKVDAANWNQTKAMLMQIKQGQPGAQQ